ncbi:MAG: helix-turn-helix domain-containing protein [Chloroflexi bacterium]|nr:helix-turn-helix domain-containing protein [Chloroflexota bacterium]
MSKIQWLGIQDAARWLGVTRQTIRNWINQGIFPAYQITPSGRVFIKAEDIQDAIENGPLRPKKRALIK